jgi:hypothetical protein
MTPFVEEEEDNQFIPIPKKPITRDTDPLPLKPLDLFSNEVSNYWKNNSLAGHTCKFRRKKRSAERMGGS